MENEAERIEALLDQLETAQAELQKAQATIRSLELQRARRLAHCFRARLAREAPIAPGGMPQQIRAPLAEIALAQGVDFKHFLELIASGAAVVDEPMSAEEVEKAVAARIAAKLPVDSIGESSEPGEPAESSAGESIEAKR